MNILEACEHPDLFAPWFKDRESYAAWFAFLAALFGLPMTDEQVETFKRHTGRSELPTEPEREAWLVIGRRGGKSFVSALVAVYLACFYDYEEYLAPGERGTCMIIAADKRQARVIYRYIRAMLTRIPMLKEMVQGDFRAEGVDLNNSVTIEVGTASFRSTRGYSYIAILCDEIAFWRSEDSAQPDFAILDAVRPGMATIPNAMMLCMSSPHAKRGALWDAYNRYFGKEGQPLVWQAATREMNPTVRQSEVDRAYERDPASASAEYGGLFRDDLAPYVTRDVVEACVVKGLIERPQVSQVDYCAFVDPSGGSKDSMTLAIAHQDNGLAVLDLAIEAKAPFSPEAVTSEFCDVLSAWGISTVTGDRYAGEWPREQFRKRGVSYELAELNRSDLYKALLPLLNSQSCRLLDSERLVNQIVGLERRVAFGGKETIDHGPNSHDDLANAVAGALNLVAAEKVASAMMFLSRRHRSAA